MNTTTAAVPANTRRGLTLMTIAGVLWGTIGPAVAFVGDHTSASPLELNLYRAVITALVLVAAAAVLRRRLRV
jgi:DME family drug/metabolite transporter